MAADFPSGADSTSMAGVFPAPFRRAAGALVAGLLLVMLGWPPAMAQLPPDAVGVEPTVGPLFISGTQQSHNCSASVLDSASRDLIITAAHCFAGSGAGVQFAPGYRDGSTPYGVWTVTQAYVDPSWRSNQDPRYDVAILKVARQQRDGRSVGVQDVVGANLLGLPASGAPVRVPAYPMGLDDEPMSCQGSLYLTEGYPSFDCPGYVGGTSGAPFLRPSPQADRKVIVGVIGGLHQGGCSDDTSYSAAFGPAVYLLRQRATAGRTPDVLPRPPASGC